MLFGFSRKTLTQFNHFAPLFFSRRAYTLSSADTTPVYYALPGSIYLSIEYSKWNYITIVIINHEPPTTQLLQVNGDAILCVCVCTVVVNSRQRRIAYTFLTFYGRLRLALHYFTCTKHANDTVH